MDANDVELTTNRNHRDTDEVYPLEELSEDTVYKLAARRQNRYFALGFVCFVVAVGVLFFGAKIYIAPGEEAELDTSPTMEQGTVSNNADNAKQHPEALRQHKQQAKKPHKMSWSPQNPDQQAIENLDGEGKSGEEETADKYEQKKSPEEQQAADSSPETAIDAEIPHDNDPKNKPLGRDMAAWHDIKVTLSDGTMYEVQEVLSHDPKSFTEGLTYHDGVLYESVGLKGASSLLVLDENTGKTVETRYMDKKFFGEGLAYSHGKLYQLTYKAKQGFIYDISDLDAPPETFKYDTTTGEGWGFTYDQKHDEFIVSDGSAFLHFWDRRTLKQVRKHQIMRLNGTPAKRINELEFWRDRVVANVWFQNVLLIINPVTGLVEKEYDFNSIWEDAGATKNKNAEVFNGISISSDPDVLYVTGKWWASMFKIKLLPEVPMT